MRPWINALSFPDSRSGRICHGCTCCSFSVLCCFHWRAWILGIRTSPIMHKISSSNSGPVSFPCCDWRALGCILLCYSSCRTHSYRNRCVHSSRFSFALSGLAVGMGAMYPISKQITLPSAASPSGVLYMVFALCTVFATLLLEISGISVYLSSLLRFLFKTHNIQAFPSCFVYHIALVCMMSSMNIGAKKLWEREIWVCLASSCG